jgi:hypothetical protein
VEAHRREDVLDPSVVVALLEEREREATRAPSCIREGWLGEARLGPGGVLGLHGRGQAPEVATVRRRQVAPYRDRRSAVAAGKVERLEPRERADDR